MDDTRLRMWRRGALCVGLLFSGACGDSDSGSAERGPGSGNTGVAQPGAQDNGAFRALIDQNQIPGPNTLDSVGFFNEHKIELPDPDCGNDVCAHGLLGVMGNLINGANCTMVMIGLNTPLDPSEVERPPLNLAIAVDTSGSMAGEPIARVKEGLARMLSALAPEDRVSLVAFSDSAKVVAEGDNGDFRRFEAAIDRLQATGATNLYDGLRSAYDLIEETLDPGRQNRVILLSDGVATAGVQETARIAELGRVYADLGIGVSTIGLGTDFDESLLRGLAESGGGTFHFVDNLAAVREIFTEEVNLTIVPIAQRAQLELEVTDGYELRSIYGTKLAALQFGGATIDLPNLYIAHRQDAQDVDGGRRGGGGVIIAELVPEEDSSPLDVGTIAFAYDDPRSGERVEQEIDIRSPEVDEALLESGYFGGTGVEKSFVALNIYAGFEIAAQSAQAGDYGRGLVALESLREGVQDWLRGQSPPDPDIVDDLEYVERLITLLARHNDLVRPMTPPNPWPRD